MPDWRTAAVPVLVIPATALTKITVPEAASPASSVATVCEVADETKASATKA